MSDTPPRPFKLSIATDPASNYAAAEKLRDFADLIERGEAEGFAGVLIQNHIFGSCLYFKEFEGLKMVGALRMMTRETEELVSGYYPKVKP